MCSKHVFRRVVKISNKKINGKVLYACMQVLNVSKFLEEHPGGEEVLMEVAGKDASKEFDDIGHSPAAQKLLLKYQVGVLQGYRHDQTTAEAAAGAELAESADAMNNIKLDSSKGKEDHLMSAFVVKDPPYPKYKAKALLEFAVPLVVAVSYFVYAS
ncbi:hypothetical protein Dimus_028040 [Dionaea muscipula]